MLIRDCAYLGYQTKLFCKLSIPLDGELRGHGFEHDGLDAGKLVALKGRGFSRMSLRDGSDALKGHGGVPSGARAAGRPNL